MTGEQFNQIMIDNGYKQMALAERWGVARQTIAKQCKADVVDPLYADAIKAIAFEKQAAKITNVISFFD